MQEKEIEFITTKDVCDLLKVNRISLYRNYSDLPHYRVGKKNLYVKNEILDFILKNKA